MQMKSFGVDIKLTGRIVPKHGRIIYAYVQYFILKLIGGELDWGYRYAKQQQQI
jgi:hypothetical protein